MEQNIRKKFEEDTKAAAKVAADIGMKSIADNDPVRFALQMAFVSGVEYGLTSVQDTIKRSQL